MFHIICHILLWSFKRITHRCGDFLLFVSSMYSCWYWRKFVHQRSNMKVNNQIFVWSSIAFFHVGFEGWSVALCLIYPYINTFLIVYLIFLFILLSCIHVSNDDCSIFNSSCALLPLHWSTCCVVSLSLDFRTMYVRLPFVFVQHVWTMLQKPVLNLQSLHHLLSGSFQMIVLDRSQTIVLWLA